MQVALVGCGRVATSLALALLRRKDETWRPTAFFVRDPASPRAHEAAAATGLQVQPLARAAARVDSETLLLIAVADRAIADVAAALAAQGVHPAGAAHTAGSMGQEALAALAASGVPTGSIHPLQTVAQPDPDVFTGAWCCVDGDAALRLVLEALASALGMQPFSVPADARPRYHAAAVLASNALVALAAAAAEAMPLSDGLSPLLPLMRRTLANLEHMGLPNALTGPVERGDLTTIRRHLEALRDLRSAARAYRALADVTVNVALRKGTLDADQATALRTLLGAHAPGDGGDPDGKADHDTQTRADETGR